MALTPDEARELAQLEADEQTDKDRVHGNTAVAAVDDRRLKPAAPESRPFSFYRATVGGLRDAFQGAMDFADTLQKAAPLPGVVFGGNADNGVVQLVSGAQFNKKLEQPGGPRAVVLPHLKGEDQAGTTERVVRGITSFVVPFSRFSKVAGVAKAATWLGRSGRALGAAVATDFTTQDPHAVNFANMMRDTFGVHAPVLDELATEENDDSLKARFKASISNVPLNLLGDAAFEAGFRGLKAYRAWRGTVEEASANIKAMKEDLNLRPAARNLEEPTAEAAAAPAKAPKSTAGAPPVEAPLRPDAPPQNFDDVLTFLKSKSGIDLSQEELERVATHLMDEAPENALSKLGIDPAKLDFSAYDKPEQLGRLQEGLSEVYERIAGGLGRTGIRITEEATAKAGRALATTADVLKDLYGHTSNLAETLMGSRLFVGAHAHKLLADAEAAVQAIKGGDGAGEWGAFQQSFYRHAYYLGSLRGAGSEVGRALRSLQMVAKVGKANASRGLKSALADEGAAQAVPEASEAGARHFLQDILDPAERLMVLSKVIEKGGDMGDLTRFVRAKNGSVLRRVDLALHETVGNLFAASTAVYNTASGGAYLGLKAMSKWLVALERAALSPLGGQFSQRARVSAMEAWAYTDGILSGGRMAVANTIALLEREGMAEVALNLEGVGAKNLAKDAAARALEGTAHLKGTVFSRADAHVSERYFAMLPSERRVLEQKIESWNGPKLLEHSMKFLVRSIGATINAAGSATRAGTIAFINATDQFMGTLAAHAGAQAHAVRLAAQEAAELQLEGKALTGYLKARVRQLTDTVADGWADDGVSAGKQEVAHAHGDAEAREILFQDAPELGINRGIVSTIGRVPLAHLVIPFVRTPLRIIERTALDFTPLGFLKDRVRQTILAGGQDAEEQLARIGLGTTAVISAMLLADDRTIIGQDGGLASSARLSRGSYTLRIGDDTYEFSRVDPLGTLLGFGADVAAFMKDHEGDPEAGPKAEQMVEASLWAAQANMLSKSWLQSIKALADLSGATDDQDFQTRLRTYLNSFATRLVPGSGIQRTVVKGSDDSVGQASTFIESLIKSSAGASVLPTRRDSILGRPVPVEAWERVIGIKGGPGPSEQSDPLAKELESLSFDIPRPQWKIEGVRLTSTEMSRWLELRGQITKDDTGLTLEQKLTTLVEMPEYKGMTRASRVDQIRKAMDGYSRLATQQLVVEDSGFASRVLRKEMSTQAELKGWSKTQTDEETRKLGQELGLAP